MGNICLDGVGLEWPAEVCGEQHNSVFGPREGYKLKGQAVEVIQIPALQVEDVTERITLHLPFFLGTNPSPEVLNSSSLYLLVQFCIRVPALRPCCVPGKGVAVLCCPWRHHSQSHGAGWRPRDGGMVLQFLLNG